MAKKNEVLGVAESENATGMEENKKSAKKQLKHIL